MKKQYCLLVMAIAGSMLTACATPTPGESRLVGHSAALKRYGAAVHAGVQQGQLPRATDPAMARLLDDASDSRRYLSGVDFEYADMQGLMKDCAMTGKLLSQLVVYELVSDPQFKADFERAAEADDMQAGLALMDQAMGKLQPEVIQLESYLARCYARALPGASAFVRKPLAGDALKYFHEGNFQLRRAMYKLYGSALGRVLNPQLPDAYRAQLTGVLVELAPDYADMFLPEQREAILQQLQQGEAPAEGVLQPVADIMSNTACEGLCLYGQSAP